MHFKCVLRLRGRFSLQFSISSINSAAGRQFSPLSETFPFDFNGVSCHPLAFLGPSGADSAIKVAVVVAQS